jgi:hypothetical protein
MKTQTSLTQKSCSVHDEKLKSTVFVTVCAVYKATHEFKALITLYYIISVQIWGGHLFKAKICKSRCSITQNKNYNLSVNGPTLKFRNVDILSTTYFPLSKQYTLIIIKHSAHHILPAILKFCIWPHVQTGQSRCNSNKHPIQYLPSVQGTVLHTELKRNGDLCMFLPLKSLSSHAHSPWCQPESQQKVTIMAYKSSIGVAVCFMMYWVSDCN